MPSTGSRLVVGTLLFGILVFLVLQLYGGRSLSRRAPDSPAAAAREAIQADNTVVGLIGGLVRFEPRTPPELDGSDRTRLEAHVVGARDSGRMEARLAREEGRWTVTAATFTLSDGTTIPVAGSAGR